jgi:hypothetical protein
MICVDNDNDELRRFIVAFCMRDVVFGQFLRATQRTICNARITRDSLRYLSNRGCCTLLEKQVSKKKISNRKKDKDMNKRG